MSAFTVREFLSNSYWKMDYVIDFHSEASLLEMCQPKEMFM